MASNEFTGMVVVDGVRYRKDDLERLHPDRVKDAVPEETVVSADLTRVVTAPGAVVTGTDGQGNVLVDVTDSSAGNVVVQDAGVPGESVGSGSEGKVAGNGAKPRASAKK